MFIITNFIMNKLFLLIGLILVSSFVLSINIIHNQGVDYEIPGKITSDSGEGSYRVIRYFNENQSRVLIIKDPEMGKIIPSNKPIKITVIN